MADLPALPPGYSLTPLPTDATPDAPAATPAVPPLPSGYALSPPQEQPQAPSTFASFGPLSVDTNGAIKIFGWEPRLSSVASGALDSAASGFTAPADAYFGRISPFDPQEASRRAMDFAQSFGAVPNYSPTVASMGGVPTAQQLKNASTAGYDAARASTATVPGADVATMAQGVQGDLIGQHGIIPKTAPKTYAILDELANPQPGAFATYSGLEAARRGLSTIAGEGGTEGFAAKKAIPALDNFIDPIAPDAADARANYAAAMRSNDITGSFDRANSSILARAESQAHSAHSGANLDNSIRQRVRTFLGNESNLNGYSPDEIAALNNVVNGSLVQNAARKVGNLLGGGGGMWQGLLSAIGGAAGYHVGGPEGIGFGMAAPAILGTGIKGVENSLARRSLNKVDEMVRMNSPLGRAMQVEQYLQQPAIGRDQAIMKTLLPGLLGPARPPQPQGGLLGPLA